MHNDINHKNVIIIPFHIKSVLLYHSLSKKGINVLNFWDNDKQLNGKNYCGIGISNPVSCCKQNEEALIIIFYKKFEIEISKQLSILGYTNLISAHSLNIDGIEDYYDCLNDTDLYKINPKYERFLYIENKQYSLHTMPTSELVKKILEMGKSKKIKKARIILLFSHELSITGAPIALYYVSRAIEVNGDIPIICCKNNGPLVRIIQKKKISVLVDYKLIESRLFTDIVSLSDVIIINTLSYQSINVIEALIEKHVPIVWWIHEGRMGYTDKLIKRIPQPLSENIHTYCVSNYSRKSLLDVMPDLTIDVLTFGIENFYGKRKEYNNDKFIFMSIGTIGYIKGQDILCEAIRKLDKETRQKCKFVFVGKSLDFNNVYSDVLATKKKYPTNVSIIGEVEYDKIGELLSMCDCMVCASRDDQMPMFISEAMMFKKICICSENTGFVDIIIDGVNGFIFKNNNADELCNKIEYVIKNPFKLATMKKKSREAFDNYFKFSVFEKNLYKIINLIIK